MNLQKLSLPTGNENTKKCKGGKGKACLKRQAFSLLITTIKLKTHLLFISEIVTDPNVERLGYTGLRGVI
ncbi:hypothetical protein DFQ12_2681 [Sphingobacterium detergens]|uniref:Uncharacterized protein n=1 Tax=Sphingobacterium detergens TaxID=1145106 RepID=A0A420B754_SPHD1|nr:hypothetical protein DFQ12_2681 [Sphingobacterium detergens]